MRPPKPHNLTADQLRVMLASANDAAGHHILWFDEKGDVHLDGPFSSRERGEWLDANNKRIGMRPETFCAGNGYCGQKAAADDVSVRQTFRDLTTAWASWRPHIRDFVIGNV